MVESVQLYLDIIRVCIALVVFGIAAYHDYTSRYIPDKLWNILIVSGGLLFSIQMLYTVTPLQLIATYVTTIGIAIAIGWTIYLLGLFGGADTKAITAIAVMFPTLPSFGYISALGSVYAIPIYTPSMAPPYDFVLPATALIFLANTAIFGLVYPLGLGLRSLKYGIDRDQPLNSLLADRVDVNDLTEYHGTVVDANIYEKSSDSAIKQYIDGSGNGIPAEFFRDYLNWYQEKYDSDATIKSVNWRLQSFINDYNEEHEHEYDIQFEGNPLADSINDIESTLKAIQKQDTVLATPGFPFIVPMFFAVLTMSFIGDLVFALVVFLN